MGGLGINLPGLLTQIVSFLILFVVLWKVLHGPVMRMLDESDSHCDFLHVFRYAQDVQREVRLLTPERR